MERGDIQLKRYDFLREAKKITDWNNVVFLDETWLNANHTLSRTWTDNTRASSSKAPMGKGSRLIICHAGSAVKKHHEEMNAAVFKDWFTTQLLPSLPEPSIIIMDNAPYHSVQVDKAPASNEKKSVHVAWLERHGIEANMEMMKPELEKLVKKNKEEKIRYEIDELAQANGHQVLRLPPYHCQYNAIELIWTQIKGI
ncbi:hypothetical protein ABMA28_003631 [Loxostege sticticalis]|uniref:Tc1-like transposase DDE domain-containing protein n=1 Tax=Loxostege sticticalis TaxID=481309 RepID=A0ABD0SWX1_LOXSC